LQINIDIGSKSVYKKKLKGNNSSSDACHALKHLLRNCLVSVTVQDTKAKLFTVKSLGRGIQKKYPAEPGCSCWQPSAPCPSQAATAATAFVQSHKKGYISDSFTSAVLCACFHFPGLTPVLWLGIWRGLREEIWAQTWGGV